MLKTGQPLQHLWFNRWRIGVKPRKLNHLASKKLRFGKNYPEFQWFNTYWDPTDLLSQQLIWELHTLNLAPKSSESEGLLSSIIYSEVG